MSIQYDHWSYDDFKAFLMLYIANADLKVSDDELEVIGQQMDPEKFNKLKHHAALCNDFKCLQVISSFRKKYFSTQEAKEDLINEIKTIALSDGKFSVYEKNIIRAINRLL